MEKSEKRYQVFISSTYDDLKTERREIIEHLLNARYFPSGMEMFSASNEDQFKYIKKIIDTCDYYVLILRAKYGSVSPTSGKSFTEMEYDYALEKNIPVLAFVHSDPENLHADIREKKNPELFNTFRDKVLGSSKMCRMWKERSELVANVIISLSQIISDFPRTGWTRGDEDSKELLLQINQLRIENESLHKENLELKENVIDYDFSDELACDDDEFEVEGDSYITEEEYDCEYDGYYTIEKDFKLVKQSVTWNGIFKTIAPDIFASSNESDFRTGINNYVKELLEIENYKISNKSYNIIKYQMLSLNWIIIQDKYPQEKTKICLTDFGKKEFLKKITIKKAK